MDPKLLSPDSRRILHSPKLQGSVILRNKKYRHNNDKKEKGKHGEVFFVLKSPTAVEKPRSKFAIKKQPIKSPRNLADRSYREFFILRQLNKLKLQTNHYIK